MCVMFIDGTPRYCLPLDNNKVVIYGQGTPHGRYAVDVYGAELKLPPP